MGQRDTSEAGRNTRARGLVNTRDDRARVLKAIGESPGTVHYW
jgi:hypothetical protein